MYHFIVNPAARSGRGLKIWRNQIVPLLDAGHIPYRSHLSEQPGDVAKIAADILASADHFPVSIVILGGDGTVNEALQGISDPSKVILSYIPTGSSNDLARDLGLPKAPAAALDLVLHGKARPMDLGSVTYPDGETRRFCVSCGIGFDAAVCQEALDSRLKKVMNKIGLGKLTYLGIALRQLFAARAVSARLTLDEGCGASIGNMLFAACMIHRFEGGGFMFAPDADAEDGILNICAVGDLPKPFILLALPTAFRGKHYKYKGITPYQAKRLMIETSSPLWVQTDGEVTRKSDRIVIACEKNSILFIRP